MRSAIRRAKKIAALLCAALLLLDSLSANIAFALGEGDPPTPPERLAQAELTTPEDTPLTIPLNNYFADVFAEPSLTTYETTVPPSNGSAAILGDSLTYTPNQNFDQVESFEVTATNGTESVVGPFSITVTPVEDAPAAADDAAACTTIATIDIDVLANDTTVETGYALKIISFTQPTFGTVSKVTDGINEKIRYTPDPRQHGEAVFGYTAGHAGGMLSDTANVTVNVLNVNSPPTFVNLPQTVSGDEGQTLAFSFSVSDIDVPSPSNNNIGITIESSNENVLKNSNIATSSTAVDADTVEFNVVLTFEDYANTAECGALSLAVTAFDIADTASKAEGGVSVIVAAVTDPPEIASAAEFFMDEDTTASLTFTVTDPDVRESFDAYTVTATSDNANVFGSDNLQVSLVSESGNAAAYKLTLTPRPNANTQQAEFSDGPVTITLSVIDPTGGTDTAVVSVTVSQENDVPTALGATRTVDEDTVITFSISALASDADGISDIAFSALTDATSVNGGTIVVSEGGAKLTYTPMKYYYGGDSFSYTVIDSEGKTATATVNITLNFVNNPPEFTNLQTEAYVTAEDTTFDIVLHVFDAETEAKTLALQVTPSANTGLIESAALQPVNLASPTERIIRIKPAANRNSHGGINAQLKLVLGDGTGETTKFIEIYITPVNDRPTGGTHSLTFKERIVASDTSVTVYAADMKAACGDVDRSEGDTLYIMEPLTLKNPANGGTITDIVKEGSEVISFVYTPALYFCGTDEVTFVVADQAGWDGDDSSKAIGAVRLTGTPVNAPPELGVIADVEVEEDGSFTIPLIESFDPETSLNDLIIAIHSGDEQVLNRGSFTYAVADGDISGYKLIIKPMADCFTDENGIVVGFTVSDGEHSVTREFNVKVKSMPDAPRTTEQKYSVRDAVTLSFNPLEGCYDPDPGDTLTIATITCVGDLNGTLTDAGDGVYNYTSEPGYKGDIELNYIVKDNTGKESPGTIAITVLNMDVGANISPLPPLTFFSEQVVPNYTLNIYGMSVGTEYTLSAEVIGGGPVDPFSFLFNGKPAPNKFVADEANEQPPFTFGLLHGVIGDSVVRVTLSYINHEGEAATSIMSFRVTAHEENSPPVASDVEVDCNEGQTIDIDVLDSVADLEDPLRLQMQIQSINNVSGSNAHVTIVQNNEGRWVLRFSHSGVYNARNDPSATFTINYTVVDSGGKTDNAIALVKLHSPNHKPYANLHIVTIDFDDRANAAIYPHSSAGDYDSDKVRLYDVRPQGNDNPTDYDFSTTTDGMSFSAATPGWYYLTYQAESSFRDIGAEWDVSGNAPLMIGVCDELGAIPPHFVNDSSTIPEDSELKSIELTGHIHAAKDTNGSMDVNVEILDTSTNRENLYECYISTATDGNKTRYFLNVKPMPNANNTHGVPRINLKITDLSAVNNGASTTGYWNVYITPINDAPEISTHTDITAGRGDYVTTTFIVTDVDFLNQIDCDKQIKLSLSVGQNEGLIVNPELCKVYPPTAENPGAWKIDVRGIGVGNATLTITATDLEGKTCSTQINVTVNAQNRAPTAKDYTVVLYEDTRSSVVVIDEDSDKDGDPLKIVLVDYTQDSSIGHVEAVGDKIIFTPAADFCHSLNYDSSMAKNEWAIGQYVEVKYKFIEVGIDGLDKVDANESEVASVWFHVNPVNDPPRYIGLKQSYTMSEGGEGTITISVADVDSLNLTFDAELVSSDDKVQSVIVKNSTRTDADGDADGSTYNVTLLIKNKQYQFHGESDAPTPIKLSTSDGDLNAIADLLLTITPVNDAPVLKDEYSMFKDYILLEIDEDTSITEALTEYFDDPDGDQLKIISFSNAKHGSVSNVGNALSFTPDADFFTENPANDDGYGWFDYTITDGSTGSYSGKVKILIKPVNDAPRLKSPSYQVDEDTVLTINNLFPASYNSGCIIWDVDNEQRELTITGVGTDTDASNGKTANGGTVSVDANSVLTYTPPADFDKQDSFRYSVSDGELTSTATITINITPDNDAPRANFEGTNTFDDFHVEVTLEQLTTLVWEFDEDTVGKFNFRVWDSEGRNVITKYTSTVSDELLPKANMAISGSGENLALTFTPLPNQFGEFVINFDFSDGVNTTTYAVNVRVRSVNDIPTISDKTISVNEDGVFNGSIAAYDIETPANQLVFSLASDATHTDAQHGSVAVQPDGRYTYTPNPSFFGYDAFYIKVTDADNAEAFAKISVTVNPMNDKPAAPTAIGMNKGAYRGGEPATITWAAAFDVASETDRANLHYEIKIVNTANNEEHLIVASTGGGYDSGFCLYNFTIPTESGIFKAYVRAIDDGKSYGPPGDVTQASLNSDWAFSSDFYVDSAKPVATHTTAPSDWTNAPLLTITLVPTDNSPAGVWQSGIATVTNLNPASATNVSGYEYAITSNGEYMFELKDIAGNTSTYTANISNFDRLAPTISATPTGITAAEEQMWTHGRTVALTFGDQPANLTDGISGVSQKLYKLVKNGVAPTDYSAYTAPIALSAKGEYSIIAQAIDKAGNVTDVTFGPYIIINAPPASGNVTGDLYRINIDSGKKSEIALALPASDPDGDALSYEWDTSSPSYAALMDYATLVGAGSSWTLTHKGGDLANDLEQLTLTLPYIVSDSNNPPATITSAATITLHPVNRVPSPSDALTLAPAAATFKGGAAISLGWGDGSDHETPAASLKYELRYKTSETGAWTTVPGKIASTTHVFIVPMASTEHFHYEVRAVDDNPATRINPNGTFGPAESDWVASPVYRIDAAAPQVTLTATPTAWTNGTVQIEVRVTDPTTGSSGIATVTGTDGYSQTYANTTTLSHVSTATTADNNSVFTYSATDHVGNTASATRTITNIDRLPPVISASPTQSSVAGYALTPIVVTLSYADATATSVDGQSGVALRQYRVYLQGETPGAYLPYTAPITLNVRGVYLIDALCTDNAGNVKEAIGFGQYEIANSAPVAQNVSATLYEHTIAGVGGPSAEITLVASDADAADTLAFSFTNTSQLPADVTLEHKGGNEWTLTYTGSDVVSEQNFTLYYKATDDCNATDSTDATVTVTLKPINDAPTTPNALTISTQGPYRGSQTVTLTVGTSTDEETTGASLVYELEWRADNGAWQTLATATGAPPASVTLPAGVSSSNLQLRMRSKDDNPSTILNLDGGNGPAYSDYITISGIAVDSAVPTATYDIFPDPEGGGIVIRLHPADITPNETWQSGFDRVEVITQAASPTDEYSSPYDYRVPGDGTYEFTLFDNAGNSYVYQVVTDMPSNPAIAYTTRYTRSDETVSVSWTHSGTSVYHYELEVYNGTEWITVVSQTANHTTKSYNYTVPTDFPDTANMAFRVRAWDNNGLHSANWSQGADIICDSTPPVIVFTPEILNTVFTNQSYGVSASVTDALSGLATAVATPTFAGSPALSELEFGETITFIQNGTLTVTAIDLCGNSATQTYTLSNIDKISPIAVATATCGGAEYTAPTDDALVFDIAFADEGVSSLVTRQYLITATDTTPTAGWVNATADTAQQTRTAIGTYYLHLKAIDGAGNETYACLGPFVRYNTPPVAQPKTVNVTEGESIDITLAATDVDGDAVTDYTIVATPSHGTLATTTQANVYRYTHNGDDPIENDFFTFTVTDANGGASSAARVDIIASEINDPPKIRNLVSPVTMNMNTSASTNFKIGDPDHKAKTLILTMRSSDSDLLPISGVRAIVSTTSDPYEADVQLIIVPLSGAHGQVTLTLTLRDPAGELDVQTLVIDINLIPQPPAARDQYYYVVPNGTVSGTINATADVGATITGYSFGALTLPTAGTLTATDGPSNAFSFAAANDFQEAKFPATITDSNGLSVSITVYIRGTAVSHENEAVDRLVTTLPDLGSMNLDPGTVNIVVTSSNTDVLLQQGCNLVFTGDGEIKLYYNPIPHAYGETVVNLKLYDIETGILLHEISIPIEVLPINDPPEVENVVSGAARTFAQTFSAATTYTIVPGGTLSGTLDANDDYDLPRYDANIGYECWPGHGPLYGTLVVNPDGTYAYTPNDGYEGDDTFQIAVFETTGDIANPNPATIPFGVWDVSHGGIPMLARMVQVNVRVAQPVTPNPPTPPTPPDGDGDNDDGDSDVNNGGWWGWWGSPVIPGYTGGTGNTGGSGGIATAKPNSTNGGDSSASGGDTSESGTSTKKPSTGKAADATPSATSNLAIAPASPAPIGTAAPTVPPIIAEGNAPVVAAPTAAPTAVPVATHTSAPAPIPATRSALLPWLLGATAVGMLLLLLITTRLTVVFHWVEGEKKSTLKSNRYFPRLKKDGEKYLDITYAEASETLGNATISLHFGILCRNRACGGEMEVVFDKASVSLPMPSTRQYDHSEGVRLPGSSFTKK